MKIRGITTDENGNVTRWSVGQSREEAQKLVDAVKRMETAIEHPSTPRQLRDDLRTVLNALEG